MSNDSGHGAGTTVCVTGAGGYIASWLVKELLERGYTVRGTVRDPSNKAKNQHLLTLAGANERLTLHKADLTEDGSFDDIIQSCDAVFHMATPVLLGPVADAKAQLLDPAVKGTENVLGSCVRYKSTVRRVVLTSSMAALCYGPNISPSRPITEADWTDVEFSTQNQLWYPLSKTEAERRAWAIAEEQGLDLVVMNPGLVLGAVLQQQVNASFDLVFDFLNGTRTTIDNVGYGCVHVKDVVLAHILGLEKAEAKGRYILVQDWYHLADICRHFREMAPGAPVAAQIEGGEPQTPGLHIDNSKARSLGVSFLGLEEMLQDTFATAKKMGII